MKRRFTFILPVLMVLGFALIGCANVNGPLNGADYGTDKTTVCEHNFVNGKCTICEATEVSLTPPVIEEPAGEEEPLEEEIEEPAETVAHTHNYEEVTKCPDANGEKYCESLECYICNANFRKNEINGLADSIVTYKDENGKLYYHIKKMCKGDNNILDKCKRTDCGGFMSVTSKVYMPSTSTVLDLTDENLSEILSDTSEYVIYSE